MDENTKLLLRFVYGPAAVTQHLELMPYGTDYKRFDASVGMESNSYSRFIPFVPAHAARFTPFWDIALNVTNGGVSNMASDRYALLGRGGLSFRFGTADASEFIIRARAGLGIAKTQLNDGKGISPPEDWTGIVQGQISLNYVVCLSKLFCVGPDIGYGIDSSSSHTSSHVYLGFIANAMISPPPGRRDTPVTPPTPPVTPPTPPVTPPTPPVIPPEVIFVIPPEVTIRMKQLEAQYSTCVGQKEAILKEKIKCQEGRDAARDKCEKEKLQCQTALTAKPKCPNTVTVEERLHILINDMPQRMILFQNDKVDLFPQKFPGKPEAEWGKGNPTLDAVLHKIMDWSNTLPSDTVGDYQIELKIRGFANETGENRKHNFNLAKARAAATFCYLSNSESTRNYKGEPVKPFGINNPEVKNKCAAVIKNGINDIQKDPLTLKDVRLNNRVALSITTVPPKDDPRDDILQILLPDQDIKKLSAEQKDAHARDVENPIWRMALIEYKITKTVDGKEEEIPTDYFLRKVK